MTDTSNQQMDSPSSSNGSSSNNSMEIQSITSSNRRSQRRRIVRLIIQNQFISLICNYNRMFNQICEVVH
jgi:hypothetical protein